MIDDMDLHGFSPRTFDSYTRSVSQLSQHYNRSPDKITPEEIRAYFLHIKREKKWARPTVTIALCGIKFFWEKTLKRDWTVTGVPVPKRERNVTEQKSG